MPGGDLTTADDRARREDESRAAAMLTPGEVMLSVSRAEPMMQVAGIVPVAWSVPSLVLGWLPLDRVLVNLHAVDGRSPAWPFILFAAFGLFWIALGARLLFEPWRLHRLYPHVFHVLTDRRFLAIDRRKGVLREIALADIRQVKIFPPFGRLTVWRRGLVTNTGRRARVRDFDGVAEVERLARRIAERTGVEVGMSRTAQRRAPHADGRGA